MKERARIRIFLTGECLPKLLVYATHLGLNERQVSSIRGEWEEVVRKDLRKKQTHGTE